MKVLAAALAVVALAVAIPTTSSSGRPARPSVLLVGTYHGMRGGFQSIQAAVNAARPGDWILVAPGDYHEQGIRHAPEPAGVLIRTPRLHLRGLDRDRVVVDGTRPGARRCSRRARDQEVTHRGRNGVEAFKVSGVYIENLTVCNYLTNPHGSQGNEIWWNGGDGTGKIGMSSWWGDYLTATSTYSKGVDPPFGDYGIYADNARGPGRVDHSYASNMGDAAYYVGACPDCRAAVVHAHGQWSALGFSGTNAGGRLTIERSEFDHNKAGPTTNSQNNTDAPSPQNGLCPHRARGPLGTGICDIWRDNRIHDNNVANVPGDRPGGLAGEAPIGTGFALAGARYVELYHNLIYDNDSWGVGVVDLPDQEKPPPISHCRGGTYITPPPNPSPLCYYEAFGNEVVANTFVHNGSFGNPTNGDIALYAEQHKPGNCFHGNSDPHGLTSDPPNIQRPPYNPCGQANGSTDAVELGQLACALDLAPCPPGTHYPSPSKRFELHAPPPQPTMPNPCAGVPTNPWCPARP